MLWRGSMAENWQIKLSGEYRSKNNVDGASLRKLMLYFLFQR